GEVDGRRRDSSRLAPTRTGNPGPAWNARKTTHISRRTSTHQAERPQAALDTAPPQVLILPGQGHGGAADARDGSRPGGRGGADAIGGGRGQAGQGKGAGRVCPAGGPPGGGDWGDARGWGPRPGAGRRTLLRMGRRRPGP